MRSLPIAKRYGIDPIFLITQTTSDERIRKIAARARGYLYLVAVLGVTGVQGRSITGGDRSPRRVFESITEIPLALGFGISTPDHAQACAQAGADGIIVGSAIVSIVEENLGDAAAMERKLKDYVVTMKRACNPGPTR